MGTRRHVRSKQRDRLLWVQLPFPNWGESYEAREELNMVGFVFGSGARKPRIWWRVEARRAVLRVFWRSLGERSRLCTQSKALEAECRMIMGANEQG